MKYIVEIGLGTMIYTSSFIKICSGVQTLLGGDRHTDTHADRKAIS
jgi:hypothetical protein